MHSPNLHSKVISISGGLRPLILLLSCLGLPSLAAASGSGPEAAPGRNRIDFNRDIRPVLSENCLSCHGPDKARRKAGFHSPFTALKLPVVLDHARILAFDGREVFTAYVPGPTTATFMHLIEKTFGKDQTTRTWETIQKIAK